ncbi:MAG TPA: hypothetical protein VJ743_08785 [Albitalea sp.]|nr:hypothetical protein [Albitalea sp.]
MKKALCAACVAAATITAAPVHAELIDALQVDTDDTGELGKVAMDLHVTTTPRGRTEPQFPTEVVPNQGWRFTPEFSLGVADGVEVGLALPFNRDASGSASLAGVKTHVKWMPHRPAEGESGFFLGGQLELSRLKACFEQSPASAELRIISGWRGTDWRAAVNPAFAWDLSGALRSKTPRLGVDAKVSHALGERASLGLELYTDLGTTRRILRGGQQSDSAFVVVDVSVHGWDIDAGIGRGITSSADALTIKFNIGIPY